jgi:branched-chain amino acid transport system substrate-binding protein
MTSLVRRHLAAGLGGALLAPLAGCERGPIELRVGIAMPLTGPLGAEGRNIVQAARLAADDIAAGPARTGAAPVRVTVVEADDQANDAAAAQAAQQLLDQDVGAAVGHLTSGCAIAAAPVYARRGVPQLSATTHPRLTQLGHRTAFRLLANDDMQARALGRHAAQEYAGQRHAVVDDGTVYGKSLAEGVMKELSAAGQAAVLQRRFGPQDEQFGDLASALLRERIGVLVTTMELSQVQVLLRQLLALGLRQLAVLGGDALKTGPVPAEAAELRRFAATTPVTEPGEFGAAGQDFVRRYQARFKAAPADTAHYVYDAVHLLAQAAVARRSAAPDVLREALPRLDPAVPITGYLRFREDGEPRYGAISLYAATKGRWRLVARSTDW